MKKVIDISKIKVGDVVETWNEGKEFFVKSTVESVDKSKGKYYVEVEEHNNKCFIEDIFSHYILVVK